jgi:hypothetical protein
MKSISSCRGYLLALAFCFSLLLPVEAQQKQEPLPPPQPTAKITGKVIDEGGQPLSGAEVTIDFLIGQLGSWGTRDLTHKGITGSDGTFSASDQAGGAASLSVTKAGHYKTYGGRYLFKEKKGTQWEPWNPTVELVLKPILKPIPMYARKVEMLRVPVVGQPVGFDLVASDWVAPHGKGSVSDLIFTLQKTFVDVKKPFEATLTITFANEDDGIQPTIAAPNVGSELRLPRFAPEAGYESKLVKSTSRAAANQMIVPANQEDLNYFFRVRTVKKDNKIVSTNYGKIDRDIDFDIINSDTALLFFTYYLNPTPNDRNMEFDPKRNLLKGLKDAETVTNP